MTRKTSPARIAAFFRALEETGNQTIAAEAARVSRSWMSLHRATDPDFRARMEAAITAARERLRAQANGVEPVATWRAINGEELAVRGTNGRRTQIARARLNQWTPRTEARFLAALAACCNVAAACRAVGMSQAAAYNHYNRWPDFEQRWDAALAEGYQALELALIENAGRAFAPVAYDQDIPIEPMSVDQAITLLAQHQARVHKIGKRPGRPFRMPRTSEEVFASIAHKLDRLEKKLRAEAAPDPAAGRRALDRGMRAVRGTGKPAR
ncbi:hypothetical protein FPZ24_00890 [Sphingomonas panacisoli]|uniref:Terminase n=1 Tax=Sphingomonas panacisoli TaxID=1813879 RepID=A0A5B8LEK7_9SPHN|nr:hypothetical protein [Sphingomonas panacisoli]QDZ06205.1 hypothetical protein FPZ24_00890 [Sphingomonas panacisoli]